MTGKHIPTLEWIYNNALSEKDQCVEWPFGTNGHGYGRATINRKKVLIPWITCEMINGPKPSEKHEVAHNCGNRLCVNPFHLRWDTRRGNMLDKSMHGTDNKGIKHSSHKLKNEDIIKIRKMKKHKTCVEISEIFGVSNSLVSMIVNKKRWSHI